MSCSQSRRTTVVLHPDWRPHGDSNSGRLAENQASLATRRWGRGGSLRYRTEPSASSARRFHLVSLRAIGTPGLVPLASGALSRSSLTYRATAALPCRQHGGVAPCTRIELVSTLIDNQPSTPADPQGIELGSGGRIRTFVDGFRDRSPTI